MPKLFHEIYPNGLYYKQFMIVNDNSSIINKFGASITDDTRVIIYDCHMFIVQATGVDLIKHFWQRYTHTFCKASYFHINATNIAKNSFEKLNKKQFPFTYLFL